MPSAVERISQQGGGKGPGTFSGVRHSDIFLTRPVPPSGGAQRRRPQTVPARRTRPARWGRRGPARGVCPGPWREFHSRGGGPPPQTRREKETRTNSAGFEPSAARPSPGGWLTSPAPAQPPAPRRDLSVEPSAVPGRPRVPELRPFEAPEISRSTSSWSARACQFPQPRSAARAKLHGLARAEFRASHAHAARLPAPEAHTCSCMRRRACVVMHTWGSPGRPDVRGPPGHSN